MKYLILLIIFLKSITLYSQDFDKSKYNYIETDFYSDFKKRGVSQDLSKIQDEITIIRQLQKKIGSQNFLLDVIFYANNHDVYKMDLGIGEMLLNEALDLDVSGKYYIKNALSKNNYHNIDNSDEYNNTLKKIELANYIYNVQNGDLEYSKEKFYNLYKACIGKSRTVSKKSNTIDNAIYYLNKEKTDRFSDQIIQDITDMTEIDDDGNMYINFITLDVLVDVLEVLAKNNLFTYIEDQRNKNFSDIIKSKKSDDLDITLSDIISKYIDDNNINYINYIYKNNRDYIEIFNDYSIQSNSGNFTWYFRKHLSANSVESMILGLYITGEAGLEFNQQELFSKMMNMDSKEREKYTNYYNLDNVIYKYERIFSDEEKIVLAKKEKESFAIESLKMIYNLYETTNTVCGDEVPLVTMEKTAKRMIDKVFKIAEITLETEKERLKNDAYKFVIDSFESDEDLKSAIALGKMAVAVGSFSEVKIYCANLAKDNEKVLKMVEIGLDQALKGGDKTQPKRGF